MANAGKPVLAFETDSMQALALVYELLDAGVDVARARDAFSAGGRSFSTGTALVDASTLGGVDIAALAAKRQTPVTGLDGYPVAPPDGQAEDRRLLAGHDGAEQPAREENAAPGPGHCATQVPGVAGAADYCVALFTLTDKIGLPGYTVTARPRGCSRRSPPRSWRRATHHQGLHRAAEREPVDPGRRRGDRAAGVHQPGRHVGTLANGTTAARNAGVTMLNTVAATTLNEPPRRSRRRARSSPRRSTSSPVAWGFDDGGFIYRDATGNPIYDPAR